MPPIVWQRHPQLVRLRYLVMMIAALCALTAGCSVNGNASNTAAAASGSRSPSAAATPLASATPSAGVSPAQPVPVLGQSRGITQGYGSVRPNTISNGGDPTGVVTDVSWTSWGSAQAVGTGTAYYDPPNVPVVNATLEQATVVAFDLGTCDGQYMYQAIEWYFPESGGSFQPATYLNTCSWTYSNGS